MSLAFCKNRKDEDVTANAKKHLRFYKKCVPINDRSIHEHLNKKRRLPSANKKIENITTCWI